MSNGKEYTDLEAIADQCSPVIARRLVEVFPGTVQYVPAKLTDEHELTMIGEQFAKELVKHFAKCTIYIPMSLLNEAQRKALILKRHKENVKVLDIALEAGCTERRVYQVLAKAKQEHDQPTLF